MRQEIKAKHNFDEKGNPTGGYTAGRGIWIKWQDGPLGVGEDRKEPNGAFVEGVIDAAIDRLEFYQSTKFNCEANRHAIFHLKKAMEFLEGRTRERQARGVEGAHIV